MVNKKYFIIGIPIFFVLLLGVIDYVTYARNKNTAIKEVSSLEYLLPKDQDVLRTQNIAGCNGSKALWSVSFNCSAISRHEYALGDTQIGDYFTSYEGAGWHTRGTTKQMFINNPASLSSPPCARLYNDRLYPSEKTRVQICINPSSISITSYSSYRPSIVMSGYLWVRARGSSQIQ